MSVVYVNSGADKSTGVAYEQSCPWISSFQAIVGTQPGLIES